VSEALARTQSNEVHLRQQLETAMQEQDAAARELEGVTSVQDQLNQEVKASQQERDALSIKVKEHGRQAAAGAEALRLVAADRKDQARINIEGELQRMTQSVDQTKALLEALKQCLAKRARVAEEEHAKRDEADRKRVMQAVEKAQEEARERWKEVEKQRTDRGLQGQDYPPCCGCDGQVQSREAGSELDELRAWHKINGGGGVKAL